MPTKKKRPTTNERNQQFLLDFFFGDLDGHPLSSLLFRSRPAVTFFSTTSGWDPRRLLVDGIEGHLSLPENMATQMASQPVRGDFEKRVSYYYDADVGNFYYGQGHPMKPHRIRMAHNLVLNYGLYRKMEVYRPHKATFEEMSKFHSDEYVRFLKTVKPDNLSQYQRYMQQFNVGEDCPVFDGLYEFCQLSAGGSVAGAIKLNKRQTEIAVNWAGGLHHAKKAEASGFCYVNDIVLAILELLKYHQRVLYVDIDVHHGDGVEEAFFTTDRVLTVSYHKYGEYFPGTGDLNDIGAGKGKHYAVNFPLRDGVDDASYEEIFQPVMTKVMEFYDPGAVVLQCGADSLTGDRLGCFNLTVKGHAKCVEFMKRFNKPLLLLGGGGYTIKNVARCWTYETAVALGVEVPNELPYNDYFEYFAPDFKLHIAPSNMSNLNSTEYLQTVKERLFENLRHMPFAPSVQQHDVPKDAMDLDELDRFAVDNANPDERVPEVMKDKIREKDTDNMDRAEGGEGSGDRNVESHGDGIHVNGRKRLLPPGFNDEQTSTINGSTFNQTTAEPMDSTSASGKENPIG